VNVNSDGVLFRRPSLSVHVVEERDAKRKDRVTCRIGANIEFATDRLESYCIAEWEPIIYDAMVLAAAVEFADKTQRRSRMNWQRELNLRIPVHNPDHFNHAEVKNSLCEVLNLLTGDNWQLEFYPRKKALDAPRQVPLNLPSGVAAVIPFSDGLDSRCVAGILGREMGEQLVRVRLGKKPYNGRDGNGVRQPFTSIPYSVHAGDHPFVESSARSRGFKFALISGLAAYLSKAPTIIVSESGQGSLGPALVTVGQAYEDYRSHPLFTEKMERFLAALLGHKVRFEFPQLWQTKAETLTTFVDRCKSDSSWQETWSCWQQNRHVSVAGKKRQCGVCAACMLRRLSVHGAGLREDNQMYVWEDLSATTFEKGASKSFGKKKITKALHEYAIAGALHLDHLAQLRSSPANTSSLDLCTFQLSRSLGMAEAEVRSKLDRLLAQHEKDWKKFMDSLGATSFLRDWIDGAQS
jgi:Queuosine biosynthesis protein QueC